MLNSTSHNPDVLSCLANLSNDEVFTPPQLVNQILDLLPKELWSDKKITFLDPVCKSGVFLREIAKRLDAGLEKQIPDRQKRLNHIFKNQVFGLAITELTSLLSRRSVYCTKTADGKYSVCDSFDSPEGNIRFKPIKHQWNNGKCKYCGASEEGFDRGDEFESHAYQFIHTDKPEEIFKMKFDVIVGNPPYQLDTGGSGRQARPIYQEFVAQAKKLSPRYLSMIIPSRWFAGGMGLGEFRKEMLNCGKISQLVDFENASAVFPGVDIAGGVCFFLWERDFGGSCTVTSVRGDSRHSLERSLNEFGIFVRDSSAIPIIRKVINSADYKHNLSQRVSPIRPFGIPTNYPPKRSGIPCWFIQRLGLQFAGKQDITDANGFLNKWKLLIPKAPIAGQTDFSKPIRFYHNKNAFVAKPGEICTESWIVACAFSTKAEVLSFKSYLFTKLVRFLILQTVVSQDVNRMNYLFVPDLVTYDREWSDVLLRKRWAISVEEWSYIDSRILGTERMDE